MKNKNAKQNKQTHPGRPKYAPKFPRSKEWTFTQFMEANGIEINSDSAKFGKGPNCTMLTLRKYMARDNQKKGHSEIVSVRGVTAEPNSESGLGRRANLYALRSKGVTPHVPAVKPVKVSTPKTAKVKTPRTPKSTSQTPTADALDRIHAMLATPDPVTPVPALTVPVVTIAPEAPVAVPEAAPAPVVEAPATSTLPVASLEPGAYDAPAPVSTLVNS